MRVHQLLSGAGPVDAVTQQALAYRRRFDAWGWGGRDHAATADPRLGRAVRPLHTLRARPEDLLLLHYSAHAPGLAPLLDRPNPTAVVYHNVTPAAYFWDWEPVTAVRCAVGREQLGRFAQAADLAIGVSAFNAAELAAAGARRTAVVPVLVEPERLGPAGPARAPVPGSPGLLFVGRLAPHKRQDAYRALALLRAERAPGATLTLVGSPLSAAYAERLRALADAIAPDAVTIESGLAPDALAARYRAADAFVSLSEHEGFCVPLLEAFHFGVPVVARPAGGVPEVAGDAALLTGDAPDLAVVAELAHAATTDPALRAELIARGRRRLGAFAPDVVAGALRAALEGIGTALPSSASPP